MWLRWHHFNPTSRLQKANPKFPSHVPNLNTFYPLKGVILLETGTWTCMFTIFWWHLTCPTSVVSLLYPLFIVEPFIQWYGMLKTPSIVPKTGSGTNWPSPQSLLCLGLLYLPMKSACLASTEWNIWDYSWQGDQLLERFKNSLTAQEIRQPKHNWQG